MAPPFQRRSKEIIDLTVEDGDGAPKTQSRPPANAQPVANGITNDSANRSPNFVPPGHPPYRGAAHAHPYVPPRPAQDQPFYRRHGPSPPAYAPSPPAKRQKLSEPPRGMVDEEQVITKSVGIHLSSYARDAVEALENKNIDKDKLKAEVSQRPWDPVTERWL